MKKDYFIELIAGINEENIPELQFAFYNNNDDAIGIIFIYKNGTGAFYTPTVEYEKKVKTEAQKIMGVKDIKEGVLLTNPNIWSNALKYAKDNNIEIVYQSDLELDEEERSRNLGL